MISDPKKTWECFSTGVPTDILHNIFFGHEEDDYCLCVKYNIQVPVSYTVYEKITKWNRNIRNNRTEKIEWQKKGCEWLEIDFDVTEDAIKRKDHIYLESIADKCKQKINNSEVLI